MTNELKIDLTIEKISEYYSNNTFAETLIYIDNYFNVNYSRPQYPFGFKFNIDANGDDLYSDSYIERIDTHIERVDNFKIELQKHREHVIEYNKVIDAKHKLIRDFMLFESQIDNLVPAAARSKVISLAIELGDDDYNETFLKLLQLVDLFRN